MAKKKSKKKQARPFAPKKKKEEKLFAPVIVGVRELVTGVKMTPEELQIFLRETRQGTGAHGVVSNKKKRRKDKQVLKKNLKSRDF